MIWFSGAFTQLTQALYDGAADQPKLFGAAGERRRSARGGQRPLTKLIVLGLGLAALLPVRAVAVDSPCSPAPGQEALGRFRHDVAEKVATSPNDVDPQLALYAAYV